jgi:hypothetical protein
VEDGDELIGRPAPEGWPVRDSFLRSVIDRWMLLALFAGLLFGSAWLLA